MGSYASGAPGAPFQIQSLFALPPVPPPSAPILGRGLNEPAQVECFPSAGAQATSTRGVGIISGGGGRGQRVGKTGSPEDVGMGGTCGIWEPKEAVKGQDAHC